MERQAKGQGSCGENGGVGSRAGFATVDPPRSRCLGYGRGEKTALEKRVVEENKVLPGKIQKALHIWTLSRAMPGNQLQSSTADNSRRLE